MILMALTTALLFAPETERGLRCVAVLAVTADKSWTRDAAFYTAIVGAEAMDATGMSREAVRDIILNRARIARANMPNKAETEQCVAQMQARIAVERASMR